MFIITPPSLPGYNTRAVLSTKRPLSVFPSRLSNAHIFCDFAGLFVILGTFRALFLSKNARLFTKMWSSVELGTLHCNVYGNIYYRNCEIVIESL